MEYTLKGDNIEKDLNSQEESEGVDNLPKQDDLSTEESKSNDLSKEESKVMICPQKNQKVMIYQQKNL